MVDIVLDACVLEGVGPERFTVSDGLPDQRHGRSRRIVCKKADAAYHSGERSGWIAVKTAAWREANQDCGELFHKPRGPKESV